MLSSSSESETNGLYLRRKIKEHQYKVVLQYELELYYISHQTIFKTVYKMAHSIVASSPFLHFLFERLNTKFPPSPPGFRTLKNIIMIIKIQQTSLVRVGSTMTVVYSLIQLLIRRSCFILSSYKHTLLALKNRYL